MRLVCVQEAGLPPSPMHFPPVSDDALESVQEGTRICEFRRLFSNFR